MTLYVLVFICAFCVASWPIYICTGNFENNLIVNLRNPGRDMLILFNNSFPRLIMSSERLSISSERLIKSPERVIMSADDLLSRRNNLLTRRNDLLCRRNDLF